MLESHTTGPAQTGPSAGTTRAALRITERANRSAPRVAALWLLVLGACSTGSVGHAEPPLPQHPDRVTMAGRSAIATFAGGCFWCMEPPFEGLPGVYSVVSGFTGGPEKNPSYKDVAYGRTGHTEAVQITYDPAAIGYAKLLQVYFRSMDPTDAGGQFADRGSQYRPGIFFHDRQQEKLARQASEKLAKSGKFDKPIVVEITRYAAFYPAEESHQDYYLKEPKHYKRYRHGSGRSAFLTKHWGYDGTQVGERRYTRPPDAELKKRLQPVQYEVTQRDGTERPFRNAFFKQKAAGVYVDVVSGEPLFSSLDKFDSGTGWPSFVRPLVAANVVTRVDDGPIGRRIEVRSKHANSHLGHVFEDGPAPTGLRYCINSASLRFVPVKKLQSEGYGHLAPLFEKKR